MGNVISNIIRINTASDLEEAFRVRREVFVDEQQVPEELELDDLDHAPDTVHILARDAGGTAVGTARFRPYVEPGVAKVERVAVVAPSRGTGLGRTLMDFIEAEASRANFHEVRLNAQLHAKDFYTKLGYEANGERFDEAGIPHIAMRKPLT